MKPQGEIIAIQLFRTASAGTTINFYFTVAAPLINIVFLRD
jgi:hypothetical protein